MDIRDLGLAKYEDVLDLQKEFVSKRIAGNIPDTLIMVEHYPVVTLGRVAEEDSIIDREFFDKSGIPVVRTGRGGKITYHAPGQLVLYPVIDLSGRKKDISFYIDFLEKTVAGSLNRLGVPAHISEERRGVWAGPEKIAFIGVAVRRWVTFHGVSVNINNDCGPFFRMHPCGEADIKVTSAEMVLGRKLDMGEVKKVFAEGFIKDLEGEYGITFAGAVGIKQ
ncbi:MAG: lipoyl(octanoyl) transferase LipB [Candidatus Omnitrophota bacterium]